MSMIGDNPLAAGKSPFDNLSDAYDSEMMEHLARDRLQIQAEKLLETIADSATTVLFRPEVDRDVCADIAQTLDRKGFRPTSNSSDDPRATVLLPPQRYQELDHRLKKVARFDPDEGVDETFAFGMRIALEHNLPEDTGVAIHEDAVAPNPRADHWSPLIVRHHNGIVRVEFHD